MFLALLPILLAGSAATGATDPVPPVVPAKEEKKICKRYGSSESRMGSNRVCKTVAEWKRLEANDQRVDVKHDRSTRSH